MTKIAKIASTPGAPYSAFFRSAEPFAKAENLQDKAYERLEGQKTVCAITGNLVEFLGNLVNAAST
jgi:hypothetical protein